MKSGCRYKRKFNNLVNMNGKIFIRTFTAFLLGGIFLLSGCNNQSEKHAEKRVEEKISEPEKLPVKKHKECFAMENSKDSIYLSITVTEDHMVSGDLSYNLYEKDSNRGEIQGRFSGDSLFADYSFNSEGQQSTREVFFLKTADGLKEGFGPIISKGNRTQFDDHQNLQINNNIVLQRVDCRD